MQAALLTRQTLSLIRSEAPMKPAPDLAQTLGWDLPRLRRVARAHGIELTNPVLVAIVPQLQKPPVRDPRSRHGFVYLQPESTIGEIIELLPRKQSCVVKLLHEHGGSPVSGRDLAAHIGAHSGSINRLVHKLAERLLPTRYHIETKAGGIGDDRGYKLVERP